MLARLVLLDDSSRTGRVLGTETLVRFVSFFTQDRRICHPGDIVDAQIHLHPSGHVHARLQRRIARFKPSF